MTTAPPTLIGSPDDQEPDHATDSSPATQVPPAWDAQALADMMEESMRGVAGATVPMLAPPPAETQLPEWADGLHKWWVETATGDIEGSLDKIVQYGGRGAAYDLIATGHDLAAMNGRRGQLTDQQAIELAICFYLSSKVNRWMAAVIDGRQPSDDTILDIVYYGMMARRNRAVGGWPIPSTAQDPNHWTNWVEIGDINP